MPTTDAPAYALADMPRRPADHRVTIAQIGKWNRARLGMREWLTDDRNGELRCKIGAGARTSTLIIVLGADDLYHVEIGQMRRKRGEALPTWRTQGTVGELFGDVLGENIDRLWSEICSR